jgi:hypothetical protein
MFNDDVTATSLYYDDGDDDASFIILQTLYEVKVKLSLLLH